MLQAPRLPKQGEKQRSSGVQFFLGSAQAQTLVSNADRQWQRSVPHQDEQRLWLPPLHSGKVASPAASWACTASRSRASLLARVFSAKFCANDCITVPQSKALKLLLQNPSRDSRGRLFHLEVFQVKQNHPFLTKGLLILKSALRPVLIAQSSFHQGSY